MDTQAPDRLVLVYHKVDTRPDFGLGTVDPEIFESHLDWLRASGFQFVPVSRIHSSNSPSCSIVFDDAYSTVIQRAYPIAKNYGCPATIAVISDYAGKLNTWDVPIGPRARHCDWEEINELAENGWEVASHSCSHRSMVGRSGQDMLHELQRSKDTIESRTGREVEHFVYPFGMRNRFTDQAVLSTGFRTMSGFFGEQSPSWIVRQPVYRYDDSSSIKRKWLGNRAEKGKDQLIQFWSHATVTLQSMWVTYGRH